jgi:iron(III) transport system substrate-binding protein
VALVAGAPHPAEARKLIDYILSPAVEEALARSASANYPVRADLRAKLKLDTPLASTIGFAEIADHMPSAIEACQDILLK